MIEHNASIRGEGRRVGIVVSRFNDLITRSLLDGARRGLLQQGVEDEAIEVAWVPGAFEIAPVLARMHRSRRFDALIALGCVIRGATPHFDYVAGAVSSGVSRLAAEADIPVIFGVLTTDTIEQAIERAGTKAGNKGWDAALAALEMAALFEELAG